MTPESIGKYRVVSRIGRGGMGVVYKAHDPDLDRPVALKVIAVDVDVSDEIRARFFHEAQACARLVHPNIVTIYDLGKAEDSLFIAMELLEGRELRHMIAEPNSLTLREKLGIVVQLCDGLAYAHQNGIVHRDIKPANIFVQQNGHVKILDFGVARIGTDPGLTRTGLIVGTLRYAAPERLRGRGDDRSDIFAIGAVLYELLTGRPAFGGDDQIEILEQICNYDPPVPSTIDASLGSDVDDVVMRALHKDPAQRFPSVRHLGRELSEIRRRLSDANAAAASPGKDTAEETVIFRLGRDGADETVHFDLARFTPVPDSTSGRGDARTDVLPNPSTGGSRVPPSTNGTTREPTAVPGSMTGVHPRPTPPSLHEVGAGATSTVAGNPVEPASAHDEAPRPAAADVTTPPSSAPVTRQSASTSPAHTTPVAADATSLDVTTISPVSVPAAASAVAASPVRIDTSPAPIAETVAGAESVDTPTHDRPTVSSATAGKRAPASRLGSRRTMAVAAVAIAIVVLAVAWSRLSGDRSQEVKQAEAAATSARQAAVAAEAAVLVAAALGSADAKAGEARRLVESRRPAEAVTAYRAAAEAYANATRLAERTGAERTQADEGRQALRAAKQRARADHPEFKTAVDRERQGEDLYARLAFKDAVASFGAATGLFARAAVVAEAEPPKAVPAVEVVATPPAPAPDLSADVRAALDAYVKAIERKDLVALRAVRPGLSDADLQRWAASFEITRSRKVDLKVDDITVEARSARATGRRQDTTILTNGQKIQKNTRFVYTLSRGPRSWVLQDLNEVDEGAPRAASGR